MRIGEIGDLIAMLVLVIIANIVWVNPAIKNACGRGVAGFIVVVLWGLVSGWLVGTVCGLIRRWYGA